MKPAPIVLAALVLIAAPDARAAGPVCSHAVVDGHVCHRGMVCRCSMNEGRSERDGHEGRHVWQCSPALGRCSDGTESVAWVELYLDTPGGQEAARVALAVFGREAPPFDTLDRDGIARLQRRLNTLGLEAGPADGIIGPATRAAIRLYQERKGYVVDGNASADLLATLE